MYETRLKQLVSETAYNIKKAYTTLGKAYILICIVTVLVNCASNTDSIEIN